MFLFKKLSYRSYSLSYHLKLCISLFDNTLLLNYHFFILFQHILILLESMCHLRIWFLFFVLNHKLILGCIFSKHLNFLFQNSNLFNVIKWLLVCIPMTISLDKYFYFLLQSNVFMSLFFSKLFQFKNALIFIILFSQYFI
jgi:hypothetical protein